jgi:hypothetical protein
VTATRWTRRLRRLQRWTIVAPTTPVRHLDPPALERRRAEVAAELNAIDSEMSRRSTEARDAQREARAEWERNCAAFPSVVDPTP